MHTKTVACKNNNFLCNNGKCISWIYRNDGVNDCGDNSDEEYRGRPNNLNNVDSGTTTEDGPCIYSIISLL